MHYAIITKPSLPLRLATRKISQPRITVQAAMNSSEAPAFQEWAKEVRTGRIKNVAPKQIPELVKEGWILLDVRPHTEIEKVVYLFILI